jgi:hypothetical protein
MTVAEFLFAKAFPPGLLAAELFTCPTLALVPAEFAARARAGLRVARCVESGCSKTAVADIQGCAEQRDEFRTVREYYDIGWRQGDLSCLDAKVGAKALISWCIEHVHFLPRDFNALFSLS